MPDTDRKFYKSTITLVILSEDQPVDDLSMEALGYAVTEGDCVLHTRGDTYVEVPAAEMARLLDEAGSEPDYFMLTPEGEDLRDA